MREDRCWICNYSSIFGETLKSYGPLGVYHPSCFAAAGVDQERVPVVEVQELLKRGMLKGKQIA